MTHTTSSGTAVLEREADFQPLVVEFLYSEDCPSHDRALEMLEQVIKDEGVQPRIDIRRVETEEEAERYRFPGSPTIRINGTDIDDNAALPVGLTCRAYRQENGRISPLPPKDKITEAIRRATRGQ